MKKKLLAALVLSMAMAAPQANAGPTGTPHDLYDTMVSGGDKVSLWTNQLINADLPKYTDKGLEINPYDETTQEPIGGYFGIESYNHHKGFELDDGAYVIGFNISEIYGFKTDGNGGAFNLTNDSSMTLDAAIDKDHPTDIYWNQAGGKGGAIFADYTWGGAVNLVNTSVFENKAHDKGGGIYIDYGALNIFANPGAEVEIIDNYQNCEYGADGNLTGGTPNDIYATLGGTSSLADRGVRGHVKLHTMGKTYDPTDPGHTGAGSITVGHMVVDGATDLSLGHSSRSTEDGAIDIGYLTLNNGASLNVTYNVPGEHDKLAIINIGELNMSNNAILNTVNNFIDKDDYNFAIGTIKLDNTDNKFFVDADLRGSTPVIDEISGVVEGGKLKLAVNIIGADTTSGSLRLFSNCSTTIEGSETQYGGSKYVFTQDPNDKGVINYQATKLSLSLQDALKDVTPDLSPQQTTYDMPDLYVADTNLGLMHHYYIDETQEPPEIVYVDRTFTINGNNGVLMAGGADISGIEVPQQYDYHLDPAVYPSPKLTIKNLDGFAGFTKRASQYTAAEGGAIFAEKTILNVDNVTFANNMATGTKGAGIDTFGMGGAIYIATPDEGVESVIKNSTFVNNKTVSYGSYASIVDGGGAIYAKGDLDIKDSLFNNNSTISNIKEGIAEGGALYFTNNSDEGGTNRDLNITNSMFIGNVAGDVLNNEELTSTEGLGGAIFLSRADANINGSTFVNNIAHAAQFNNGYTDVKGKAQGGAIHIDKWMTSAPYAVNINDSTFALNTAEAVKAVANVDGTYTLTTDGANQQLAYGGAIAIMPPSGSEEKLWVNITDSDFVANKSGNGGAIYNYGSTVNIKDSSFNGNQATYYYIDPADMDHDTGSIDTTDLAAVPNNLGASWNEDMTGGAIYNDWGVVNLDNVTFSSNYAKQIAADNETVNTVKNDIRNNKTVNFIGKASTLDGGITGSGRTYFNLDDGQEMTIGANTSILQTLLEVNSGAVTIKDADNITARAGLEIGENGTLNVDKGQFVITNKYVRDVENNGTLNILHNSADEHQVLDFIADNVDFTNNGILTSGGSLTRDIAGTGTLKLNDVLDVQSDRVIAGTLDMNGQDVNLSDGQTYNNLTVGNLKGTGNLKIDSSFGGETTTSDKILISNGANNNANLVLKSINIQSSGNITEDKTDYITFLDVTEDTGATLDGITASVANGSISTVTSSGKKFTFTNGTTKGKLDVTVGTTTPSTLAEFIDGTAGQNVTTYSMDGDIVTADLGTTTRADGYSKDLFVNLNGYDITAGDESGIIVDAGYTLNVDGANGSINGFDTAFMVNEGGVLNISDVTFENNDADIESLGTVNFDGTNELDNITGVGSISVAEGAELTVNEILLGKTVNNNGELNIGNSTTGDTGLIDSLTGTGDTYIIGDNTEVFVTSALEQGHVYNGGDLILGSAGSETPMTLNASIQNRPTGGWWPQYDGGMTIIDGDVIASDDSEIRQYITINEKGNLAINANGIGNGSTEIAIAEGGALTLLGDGSTIANGINISGDGTTVIEGADITNNANLSTYLEIADGAQLTSTVNNLANVKGAIDNDGDLVVNSNGGWFATNYNKDITGDGTTTFNGNITSGANIENDVVVATGNFTNNGAIDGDVENDATFTNNGAISGVFYNNEGANLTGNGSITSLDNEGTASIAADSVSDIIVNNNELTLNGSNNPFVGPTEYVAAAAGEGTTTITGNVNIAEDAVIAQSEINIGSSNTFGFGGSSVTNNGTVAADELNINGSGWGATTLTNNSDIVADTINASANGFGSVQIVNDSSIDSENIILGNNASLSLNTGSETSGDVQLTTDPGSGFWPTPGSVINMQDGAVLDGNILADAGTLNFNATDDDLILSESITGEITGSDPESENPNGSYIVNANGGDSVVVLDKTLLGAKEINASGDVIISGEDDGSTSDRIGDAQINIADMASVVIESNKDEFVIDNNVVGDGLAEFVLDGRAGEPESATNAGTQFSIADGTTISDTLLYVDNGELLLPDESNLDDVLLVVAGSSVDPETGAPISGATLNTINGTTSDFMGIVTFDNEAQVKVDVNAKSGKADHFYNVMQSPNDTAILTDVDLQDLSKITQHTTKVDLSEATGIENLKVGNELLNKTFTEMTPIRKMTASFDENGMMTILPSNGNNNNWKEYNPAILAAPIAAQFGGYLTQLNAYNQAFSNMDMYMMMPRAQRIALKFQNKIASTQGDIAYDPTNSPNNHAAGWFRPFASYEKTNLHHGPEVESTAYGSYFGGDSSLKDLGHGWEGMWGAYVGYNGSHQSYTNTSIYQNGGTLGVVGMAYKDNFFVGGTINSGASAGEASTSFGSEEFAMLMAGAALKTGYNWELANGKFIIQPSLMTAYTFVNTFDYTNAAGIRIDSNPLHAITIEPGVKFIGNLKNGWQPYAGVSLVYTIMDRADVMANDIALPNISINPYVKYGLGVRKTWGDRFSGFLQTFFTSGGRNGIGVQAGFRWAIGKNGSNNNISGKTPELKETKISLNNKK